MTASDVASRLAFAADLPLPEATRIYKAIAPHVGWAKVGLSLFVEHGPAAIEAFRALGAKVFLDLKLHDIPNTVELAAARAAAHGVGLLTVHASGGRGMLEAARRGAAQGAASAGHPTPRILAVTVLTSMTGEELGFVGVSDSAHEQALRLARLAQRSGLDGLVCSAFEAPALRTAMGGNVFICTPGIRPDGVEKGDQARVDTPAAAIHAGSNLLVVGRPIYAAADPVAAARAIADEAAAATRA